MRTHVFSTFFNNRSKTCRWNDHAKCLFMWYFTCKARKFIIYRDFNLISKKSKIAAKMATIRELMIDKFSGNGNFNQTWHHDLGDTAHARRRETGSVWRCSGNVSIYLPFQSGLLRLKEPEFCRLSFFNCPCFLWVTFQARFPSSVIETYIFIMFHVSCQSFILNL